MNKSNDRESVRPPSRCCKRQTRSHRAIKDSGVTSITTLIEIDSRLGAARVLEKHMFFLISLIATISTIYNIYFR
jgi:hypothetical protein